MTLPHILIIDDVLSTARITRNSICKKCRLLDDEAVAADRTEGYLAEASFCSGQIAGRNSYEVIEKAVSAGFSADGSCRWSLVFLDLDFGGKESFGLEVQEELLDRFPNLPIVMLTGQSEAEVFALKQKMGSRDIPYLSKFNIDSYHIKIELLSHGSLNDQQIKDLLQLKREGHNVVAQSEAMTKVFREAFIFAHTDASILILGETGTGKEEVAKYIHDLSPRKAAPFVAVNCAAVPEALIESELFGHERGAFTGATGRKIGKFEAANRGTLFLDEIGDMSLDAQAKILRALQERKIERLGGGEEISINIRLLSATSKDLGRLMRKGRFREDVYTRIAAGVIEIPPLRERRADISPLAVQFLESFQKRNNRTGITFSEAAFAALEEQTFNGNVRELDNIVGRIAVHKGNNSIISRQDVLQEIEKDDRIRKSSRKQPSSSRHGLRELQPDSVAARLDVASPATPGIKDLTGLENLLQTMQVPASSTELQGKLASLQYAYGQLLKRLLETALQQAKVTGGDKNILPAIRSLLGREDLKDAFRAFDILLLLDKVFSFDCSPESELGIALRKAKNNRRPPKKTGDLPNLKQ